MASMNRVFLIGNLVRPPELRYTPSGTAVSDLRVAVNRDYTTQSGERRQETDFLTVVVWGKQAETSAQYLDKGSPVLIEGRLQTREWEGKDGQRRNVVEVVAQRIQFLGRLRPAAETSEAAEPSLEAGPAAGEDEVPF
jgi:single-strand DNA-binding protein